MQLQRLNDNRGLSDSVIEKAAYIYRKIRQRKLTNGISIKIVIVSALYIACREMEIPRTLREISEISNTDEKKSSRFYKKTILELDIKVPQADPLKMMNDIVRGAHFINKDTMGLAGAVVYLACKKHGKDIIQYEIANATGVTLTTLRKDLRFLENFIK